MSGIHAEANARERRKATWLLVTRSSAGPIAAIAARSALKMERDSSCPEKNLSSIMRPSKGRCISRQAACSSRFAF
jgi:hypothetical protein